MKILLLVLFLAITMPCFAGDVSVGGFYTPTTKVYSGTDQASGTIVWAPASGKKIVLFGLVVSVSGGVDNSTTASLGTGINKDTGLGQFVDVIPMVCIASGPIVIASGVPIWEGTTDGTLAVTTSKSITAALTLWGYEK